MEKIYNATEAAQTLGVSRPVLYKELKRGAIRANRIGDQWRILESSLLYFLRGGDEIDKPEEPRQAA